MNDRFLDTNVVLYLLDDSEKSDIAEKILCDGGVISVQVLNEALVNCIKKAKMSFTEAGEFLTAVQDLCHVVSLTPEVHDIGRALADRYQLSVYDSMIVSAALLSGCRELLSEDMQDGMEIEGSLRIVNPFK